MVRNDWTLQEIQEIYNLPLLDLIYRAATTHRQYNNTGQVQVCTLLSIKTGGCTEDCKYCSQSIHHNSGLKFEPLMKVEDVLSAAKEAKEKGSTRFCMGAAWREVTDGRAFERVLEMVRGV